MSRLIKPDGLAADRVRSLPSLDRRPAPAPPVDPFAQERAAHRGQVASFSRAADAAKAEIAELKRKLDLAFEEGRTQGHAEGLQAAQSRQAERLARLEGALVRAGDEYQSAMARVEALSGALALAGLGKILGPSEGYPELVATILRRQLAVLDRAAVIQVEVSSDDFPDPAALTALAAKVGGQGLALSASETLAAGDCRIGLRLSTLEVGVNQQWTQLQSLFAEMFSGGGDD